MRRRVILGWQFVDLDERIEADAGTTIDAIFAEHGEPHFRDVEAQTLLAACESERQVVSTGGGIAENADNRAAMMQHGAVVCLEAAPETIYERVLAQSAGDDAIARPMLAANDPLERIRSLKSLRQLNYTLAHWTVHTDILTPEQAASEVVRAFDILNDGRHRYPLKSLSGLDAPKIRRFARRRHTNVRPASIRLTGIRLARPNLSKGKTGTPI